MDMRAWLGTLSRQQRRIAKALALGETTNVVARKFGLSPGSHQPAAVAVSAALGAIPSRDEHCRMCGLRESSAGSVGWDFEPVAAAASDIDAARFLEGWTELGRCVRPSLPLRVFDVAEWT